MRLGTIFKCLHLWPRRGPEVLIGLRPKKKQGLVVHVKVVGFRLEASTQLCGFRQSLDQMSSVSNPNMCETWGSIPSTANV